MMSELYIHTQSHIYIYIYIYIYISIYLYSSNSSLTLEQMNILLMEIAPAYKKDHSLDSKQEAYDMIVEKLSNVIPKLNGITVCHLTNISS